MGGDLHSFGMERADPEPRDADQDEDEPVGRRNGRERDAGAADGHADGHQPDGAVPVGPVAEKGLRERRGRGRDEHDPRRHRVGQVQRRLEKDEQRGQRALGQICGEMPERDARHRPAVEASRHRPRLHSAP